MGCNGGKFLSVQKTIVVNSIIDSIDRNDCSRVKDYLEIYANLDKSSYDETKDKLIIHHREMDFSVLGFCLWTGKALSFQYCIERLGCSFTQLESSFQSLHIFPLNFICEQGQIELLKIYLPHYLLYLEALDTSQRSFTARLEKQKDNYSISSNAVQLACYSEHLSILCYINDYFSRSTPPNELDLHYIDEQTGENCALISCRSSNLSLLKVLHEKIRGNFHLKNHQNKGALEIMTESSIMNSEKVYLPCFIYLIEVIKVDLREVYDKIIEVLTDIEVIHYLQKVFKKSTWSKSEGDSFLKRHKDHSVNFTFDDDLSDIIKASYEGSILI